MTENTRINSKPYADWLAYQRDGGVVGVRNLCLILNLTGLTDPAARKVASELPTAAIISFPYGMGVVGDDLANAVRTLTGLACHPNVGSVLLISADQPLLNQVSEAVRGSQKPFATVSLKAVGHDAQKLVDQAKRSALKLAYAQSRAQRVRVPISDLCVAMECGLSDPSSGFAANPLIGKIADRIVTNGGTVILGETLEWLGVEDQIADRAVNASVADDIRQAVQRREALALNAGVDLAGSNPNQRNIDEGLTTIEEKAAGSIAKSGTASIQGVLAYGERPKGPGLWLMDAPSYTPESLTGFAAAGAQIALFSTGSGNSYCSAVMPTIKLTANSETARRLDYQIDFDCSTLMTGGDFEDEADRLWNTMVEVASGAASWGELMGEQGEIISRFGEAL